MSRRHDVTIIFFIMALMLSLPFSVKSQTKRIRSGETAEGICTYREVYEYDYVTDKPCFPGGDCKLMNFINDQRRYPEEAYKNGIQGRVVCSFVINTDGSVSNIEVLKGVCPSLNAEAVRILSRMPLWSPGRINNQPVPVRVIHPVAFRR